MRLCDISLVRTCTQNTHNVHTNHSWHKWMMCSEMGRRRVRDHEEKSLALFCGGSVVR